MNDQTGKGVDGVDIAEKKQSKGFGLMDWIVNNMKNKFPKWKLAVSVTIYTYNLELTMRQVHCGNNKVLFLQPRGPFLS